MKYTLIALNSQYIHSNLALTVMAQLALDAGEEVSFLEFSVNESKSDILHQIPPSDIYCFSAYIWNRTILLDLMGDLQKLYPQAQHLVGGPEAWSLPEQFLQLGAHVVMGEGETAFQSFLNHPQSPKRWVGIATMTQRPPLQTEANLDFPYPFAFLQRGKIVYYESQRGCLYRCSYCLSSCFHGVRYRNLELVKKDLTQLRELGVPLVKFVDRSFNADIERAVELLEWLQETDQGQTNFHLELSPHCMDERLIESLEKARADLFQYEIGIQSFDPGVLRSIHRPRYAQGHLETLADFLKRVPGHRHLDLIVGLPGMGYEQARKDWNKLYGLGCDDIQIGFLKVLPGTPMVQIASEVGIVYSSAPPYEILQAPFLSFEEIGRLKRIEVLSRRLSLERLPYSLKYLFREKFKPFEFYEFLESQFRIPLQARYEHMFQEVHRIVKDETLRELLEIDYRLQGWRHLSLLGEEREVSFAALQDFFRRSLPKDDHRKRIYLKTRLDENLTLSDNWQLAYIEPHKKMSIHTGALK